MFLIIFCNFVNDNVVSSCQKVEHTWRLRKRWIRVGASLSMCVRRKSVRDGKKRMDWETRNGLSQISSNSACSSGFQACDAERRGGWLYFLILSFGCRNPGQPVCTTEAQYFGLQDWVPLRLCLIQLWSLVIGYTNLKNKRSTKVFLRDSRPKSWGQHP